MIFQSRSEIFVGSILSAKVLQSRIVGAIDASTRRQAAEKIQKLAGERVASITQVDLKPSITAQIARAREITIAFLCKENGYREDKGNRLAAIISAGNNASSLGDSASGVAAVYVHESRPVDPVDIAIVEAHELDHVVGTMWEVVERGGEIGIQERVGYDDMDERTRHGGCIEDCLATLTMIEAAGLHQKAGVFKTQYSDRSQAVRILVRNEEQHRNLINHIVTLRSPLEFFEGFTQRTRDSISEGIEFNYNRMEEYILIKRLIRAVGHFTMTHLRRRKEISIQDAMETGRQVFRMFRRPSEKTNVRDKIYTMFLEAFGEAGREFAQVIWETPQDPDSNRSALINAALSAIEAYQGFSL